MADKKNPAVDVIPASSLIPNLEIGSATASYWYWVGLSDDCPLQIAHVGGVALCKMTEIIRQPSSDWAAPTERIKHPGQIVRMSRAQVELFAERLSRTIVRVLHAEPSKGEGEDTGDRPVRHAVKVQIPSEAELAEKRAQRRTVRGFVPREGDQPLAKYAYAVLIDERRPRPRGQHDVAPTIAEVGIPLPTESTTVAAPTGGLLWDSGGIYPEADKLARMEKLLQ